MPRKPSCNDDAVIVDVTKCLKCATTMETKRFERHMQMCNVDPMVRQREEQERAVKRAEQKLDRELAARIAARDEKRAWIKQERLAHARELHARERKQERALEEAAQRTQRDATLAAERWRVHVLRPGHFVMGLDATPYLRTSFLVVFDQVGSIDGELTVRVWARPDGVARPGEVLMWRPVPPKIWEEHRKATDGDEAVEVNGKGRQWLETQLDDLVTWTSKRFAAIMKC